MVLVCAGGLRDWLQNRYVPGFLAVLAMVLCSPSLWLGWQLDDYFHRGALSRPDLLELARSPAELFVFVDGGEEANRRAVDFGLLPWWSHEKLRISFWRPLTGVTFWLDYWLWPRSPALMHVHSLMWLGAVVVVATVFYRRMFGPTWVAGLAALLFAVDDAHGWPAAWLANRSTMLGVFFGLLTLIAYDRWRRDGWRMGAVLAPAALLLGLLAKESVAAAGAYLLAYALFVDRGAWLARLRALGPCAVTGVLWWATYRVLGYGAAGTGMYLDPGASPVQFVQAIGIRAPVLLFGQWLIPSDLHAIMSPWAVRIGWLAAVGFLVVVAACLAPLVRRDGLARFWTTGMVLAVVPACAVIPADRLLFFVGISAMGLLAQFIAGVLQKAEWRPMRAWWRWPAQALCVLLVAVHLGVAPLALAQTAANLMRHGGIYARAAISLPSDPSVLSQTLVIVNSPAYFVFAYSALMHAVDGEPFPARSLVLGSSLLPVEIRRPDARTLVVRSAGGYFASSEGSRPGVPSDPPAFDVRRVFPFYDRWLYRDDSPMRPGQRIELTFVTIEIMEVTDDGRPVEVSFRFTRGLECRCFRWMQWQDGIYVPFVLPAVGGTVKLAAATIPL